MNAKTCRPCLDGDCTRCLDCLHECGKGQPDKGLDFYKQIGRKSLNIERSTPTPSGEAKDHSSCKPGVWGRFCIHRDDYCPKNLPAQPLPSEPKLKYERVGYKACKYNGWVPVGQYPNCPNCHTPREALPNASGSRDEAEPLPSSPSEATELEAILDAHAEYYIRQTMKFFSENGESPALSRNNEGDLAARKAIEALTQQREVEAKKAGRIDERRQISRMATRRQLRMTAPGSGHKADVQDCYVIPAYWWDERLKQINEEKHDV